jgi:hypothetical protein
MSESTQASGDSQEERASIHQLLLRLDLATEVLEGLDELGLETRAQVEELLTRLERQIADSD